MTIRFTVPGPPVGKGRPRFARRGRFVTTYTPAKTARYEHLVRLIAATAMRGAKPVSRAMRVTIEAHYQIPVSWPERRKREAEIGIILPAVRPDIDNVAKAVMDGIIGVAIEDDALVCDMKLAKRYAIMPRVEVAIEVIGE